MIEPSAELKDEVAILTFSDGHKVGLSRDKVRRAILLLPDNAGMIVNVRCPEVTEIEAWVTDFMLYPLWKYRTDAQGEAMTFDEADKLNHPQTAFTKARSVIAEECATRIFDALPKPRRIQVLGELNDLLLFIDAARAVAPDEPGA